MDGAACLVFKTIYFCETKNNQTLSLTFYIVCGVYGLNMQPLKCRPYTNGLEKPKKHQALLRLQRKSTNKPKQFQLCLLFNAASRVPGAVAWKSH